MGIDSGLAGDATNGMQATPHIGASMQIGLEPILNGLTSDGAGAAETH
jgi:hypothetical protein